MPPKRRKKAEAKSRGLSGERGRVREALGRRRPRCPRRSARTAARPLGAYRDPLGGHWQLLAALPIDKVEPTPFQRDLSEAHVKRLTGVIDTLDRFLDPIIAVRGEDGRYWTPNGNHRLGALRNLGARSVVGARPARARDRLQDPGAQHREGAQPAREVARGHPHGARPRASATARPEKDYALEFEEAAFLTLGVCYEKNGRFAGGAYHPILKRVDAFLDKPLAEGARDPRASAPRSSSSSTRPSRPP